MSWQSYDNMKFDDKIHAHHANPAYNFPCALYNAKSAFW